MNKIIWTKKLSDADKRYNFFDGYKLLYCPGETIHKVKIAFISLNPGKPPQNAEFREISDERGNSYWVERKITESPITDQFLKLCEFIKKTPDEILTGAICPFRSKNWDFFMNGKVFTDRQKEIGLNLGAEFWKEALKNVGTIVTVGNETTDVIKKILGVKQTQEINSGWSDVKLRRYENHEKNISVIHLPHLSTYKLFSRPECREPLKKIFKLIKNKQPVKTSNIKPSIKKAMSKSKRKSDEYFGCKFFRTNREITPRHRAEHNKTRWRWIDNNGNGRTYSEISRADSIYRQNIKDPNYHGKTSDVDPHLKYDIEKVKMIEIR